MNILKHFKINIYEFNLILILIGFSTFTSFVSSSAASIAYRAFALFIGLICCFKPRGDYHKIKNEYLSIFLFILTLFTIRVSYDLWLGFYSSNYYAYARNNLQLFMFGITWIPFIGFLRGFDHIRWKRVLLIMAIILSFILLKGYITSASRGYTIHDRVALNERQSTLAFGDNGALLVIIAISLLRFAKLNNYIRIFLIGSIIIGFLSIMKAGSRGPFVSCLFAVFFFGTTIDKRKIAIICYLAILALVLNFIFNFVGMEIIYKYAPVLTDRINLTIEDSDMSGRDVIFKTAMQLLNDNPIFGAPPIILGQSGFSGYHNNYLTTALGLGYIFGIVFAFLAIKLLYYCFRYRFKILNIQSLFFAMAFVFYFSRAMSGVSMVTNCSYCVIFSGLCVIAYRLKKYKFSIHRFIVPA